MWMGMGLAVGQPPRAQSGGQAPIAPVNTVLPVISGTATQGQTLTASTGTWSGDAPITYAYQWQRGGVAIAGATGSNYVLEADEVGLAVRVVVTASNMGGVTNAVSLTTVPVAPLPAAPVTAILYAQSEVEYLLKSNAAYRQIAQPTPGNGNLIVFTQDGDGATPVRTVVNPTTVAAGEVNPTMAAWSALFNFAAPGRQFVVGDGAVPGTSRVALHNTNTTDGRLWSDFTSVVNAIEGEFGTVRNLIECWYNSDAGYIGNFGNAFWPSYFGRTFAGGPFTLGTTNPVTNDVVGYTLWDGDAASTAKGRGIFTRADTTWHILTPMPFCDGPTDPTPESPTFSQGLRNEEPARDVMHGLTADPLAQSVRLVVGPSAHLTNFGGGIHPITEDRDGQILFGWPMALAMLRASGMTIGEPVISAIEGPTNGTYADLVVDLPNGGTLTTLRALRVQTLPTTAPHQQAVTGVEINRAGGTRRPVYRNDQTTYPTEDRGTVSIIDSGSGSPKKGRVRITPASPFAFGDALSYLRGQATAMLQEPRDVNAQLYRDMLIEHVPGLYDATALYPMEGIAVRPFQSALTVPVPAPPFAPRGAYFDGASYYASNSVSRAAGSNGLLSMWFRSADAVWNTPARRILQFRVGTTSVVEIGTSSAGRLFIRMNNDTASDTLTIYSSPTNAPFVTAQWYHLMAAWTGTGMRVYVNGVFIASLSYASLDMAGQNVTQIGIGAISTGATPWLGSLAHLWMSFNQTLDLSLQANRQKFVLAGVPVNLGANGQTPTGIAPAIYYDGAVPAWANQGTMANVPLTGVLTASSTVPGY